MGNVNPAPACLVHVARSPHLLLHPSVSVPVPPPPTRAIPFSSPPVQKETKGRQPPASHCACSAVQRDDGRVTAVAFPLRKGVVFVLVCVRGWVVVHGERHCHTMAGSFLLFFPLFCPSADRYIQQG
eukprot:RCo021063